MNATSLAGEKSVGWNIRVTRSLPGTPQSYVGWAPSVPVPPLRRRPVTLTRRRRVTVTSLSDALDRERRGFAGKLAPRAGLDVQ